MATGDPARAASGTGIDRHASGQQSDDVVILLAADPRDDPWGSGALGAAEVLRAQSLSVRVDVAHPKMLPDAAVVLCHGVQFAELASSEPGRAVILSDLPGRPLPPGLTAVDWAWPAAAATAARSAARIGGRVGFVAGPAVPTQRRVVESFVEAAVGCEVAVVHLPAFDDLDAGRQAGRFLAAELGCQVVGHSADDAGRAATAWARAHGSRTIGFLQPAPGDLGWIHSDIAGVLSSLVRAALNDADRPDIFVADEASGFGGFVLAASETAPETAFEMNSGAAEPV